MSEQIIHEIFQYEVNYWLIYLIKCRKEKIKKGRKCMNEWVNESIIYSLGR